MHSKPGIINLYAMVLNAKSSAYKYRMRLRSIKMTTTQFIAARSDCSGSLRAEMFIDFNSGDWSVFGVRIVKNDHGWITWQRSRGNPHAMVR